MKFAVGSDHAGWEDKNRVADTLRSLGHQVVDFGTDSGESCDYPDYAAKVGRAVADGLCEQGVLVCGTGIGMSIAANKIEGIRAAACQLPEAARLARRHNDANVLCVGARVSTPEEIREIVGAWLGAAFEGGRHARRVGKITALDHGRIC